MKPKMRMLKSVTGLLFAGVYLAAAIVMFAGITNCSGMFCDLEAWPVVVPFGFVCIYVVKALDLIYFFGSSYTMYRWSNPAFMLPTMVGNLVFYYYAGVFFEWCMRKMLKKPLDHS